MGWMDVSFCEDMCVQTKTICTYNNKLWFTPNLRKLRQTVEKACRSGDKDLFKQARNRLTKETMVAKAKKQTLSLERPAAFHQLQETIPPACRKPQLTT